MNILLKRFVRREARRFLWRDIVYPMRNILAIFLIISALVLIAAIIATCI